MGGSGVWDVMPISIQSAIGVQKRVQGDPGVELKLMCSSAMFKGTSWCLTRCWNSCPTHSNSKTSRLQQTGRSATENSGASSLKKRHFLPLNHGPIPLHYHSLDMNNKASGSRDLVFRRQRCCVNWWGGVLTCAILAWALMCAFVAQVETGLCVLWHETVNWVQPEGRYFTKGTVIRFQDKNPE